MAKQLSRPGAQVTRSSSGSGLGMDTGHWTKLTGWQRSRGSRRQSCPSEPRLAMLGPGPRPPASAHHLPPADPEPGLRFSDGVHFWRVSTSPRRPEVQQKAKVSVSRTCRLLSNSSSLTPGRRGEKSGCSQMGPVVWHRCMVQAPSSGQLPTSPRPSEPHPAAFSSHTVRPAGWVPVPGLPSPAPEQGPPRPGPVSRSSRFPSSWHTGLDSVSSVAGWGWEEPARGCGT